MGNKPKLFNTVITKIISPASALILLLITFIGYANTSEIPAIHLKSWQKVKQKAHSTSGPVICEVIKDKTTDIQDGDKFVVALWINIHGVPTRIKYNGGSVHAALFKFANQVTYYDYRGTECPRIDVILDKEVVFSSYMSAWPEE